MRKEWSGVKLTYVEHVSKYEQRLKSFASFRALESSITRGQRSLIASEEDRNKGEREKELLMKRFKIFFTL